MLSSELKFIGRNNGLPRWLMLPFILIRRILLLTYLSSHSVCAYHMFWLSLLATGHCVQVHMEVLNSVEWKVLNLSSVLQICGICKTKVICHGSAPEGIHKTEYLFIFLVNKGCWWLNLSSRHVTCADCVSEYVNRNARLCRIPQSVMSHTKFHN